MTVKSKHESTDTAPKGNQSSSLKELCKSLLAFQQGSQVNIDALLKLGGRLLEADFVLVNRFEGESLETFACWKLPADLKGTHPTGPGTLCGDLLTGEQLMVVRHLDESTYQHTDSAVASHNLKSYIGHPVRVRNKMVGTLCLLYYRHYAPRDDQLDLLGIIAAVIGIEIERQEELSKRQRIEEALRVSEEKYRALAENNLDVIMRFDRELRHLYVNPAVKGDTGLDAAAFIGKTNEELGFPPHLIAKWEDALETVFHTGKAHRIEFGIDHPDGRRTLDWQLNPEFGSDGTVTTVMTTARNITDRKAAEQQREVLLQQLHQAKKMEAIGLLAAGVAHELNNPLCAISGYAELLLEQDIPADARRRATKIHKQSQRCQVIVDDLLLFSRQHEPRLDKCQLMSIATNAAKLGEYKWKQSGVQIIVEGDEGISCELDSPLIEQALINLIDNAVEASTKGQKVHVNVVLGPQKRPSIAVSDSGIGLAPAVEESMFTPFFTTKGVGEGTGLGLSIVQGIIEKHSGELVVESEVGGGTCVRILLPPVPLEPKKT
jgi:PAS domain S-box-containing protein